MSLIITFMLEPAKLQRSWARARGTSSLRGETAVPATFRLSAMRLPFSAYRGRRGGEWGRHPGRGRSPGSTAGWGAAAGPPAPARSTARPPALAGGAGAQDTPADERALGGVE